MIALVVVVFVFYGLYQIPRIVQRRQWNELVVFCLFFGAGFLLSAMLALGIAMPSPSEAVEGFLNALNLHY